VGVEKEGNYGLENADIIKSEWQGKFGSAVDSLEIVYSESTDDVPVKFYMLLAKTANGARLATVLKEENGRLFLDENGIITSCRSQAGEIFQIKGISQDGRIRLYCADCNECEKTESGL
jgi:hypothetical protein